MKTKLFRIGESAVGGLIKAEVYDNRVTIKCIDARTHKLIKRNSFRLIDKYLMTIWLEDRVTTSYHAEQIINEIYA